MILWERRNRGELTLTIAMRRTAGTCEAVSDLDLTPKRRRMIERHVL